MPPVRIKAALFALVILAAVNLHAVAQSYEATLLLVRNNEPLKTVTVDNSSADKDGLIAKIVRAVIENAPKR